MFPIWPLQLLGTRTQGYEEGKESDQRAYFEAEVQTTEDQDQVDGKFQELPASLEELFAQEPKGSGTEKILGGLTMEALFASNRNRMATNSTLGGCRPATSGLVHSSTIRSERGAPPASFVSLRAGLKETRGTHLCSLKLRIWPI